MIDAARAGNVLPLTARAYRLTGRELEVVRCVLNGLDTRSVAASLHIAEYTVQDHLKSVFGKVGVRSRRELAHGLAVGLGIWDSADALYGPKGSVIFDHPYSADYLLMPFRVCVPGSRLMSAGR